MGWINLEFFIELILEFVMGQFLSFNVLFLKSAEWYVCMEAVIGN